MRLRTLAVLSVTLLIASLASAQFRRLGDTSIDAHRARPDSYDGKFHYCRAIYRQNPRGDGGSWLTDYPLADIDLSIRLSELTKIAVGFDAPGEPRHLIVSLTDEELYQCPIIIMQEVGRVLFTGDDAERLRTYLLKGGFLWVDDFWGSYAWDVWQTEIQKVFPPDEYPIVDLPRSHPLYHTMFDLEGVPRSRALAPGLAAGKRRSAVRTAPRYTRARFRIVTGA